MCPSRVPCSPRHRLPRGMLQLAVVLQHSVYCSWSQLSGPGAMGTTLQFEAKVQDWYIDDFTCANYLRKMILADLHLMTVEFPLNDRVRAKQRHTHSTVQVQLIRWYKRCDDIDVCDKVRILRTLEYADTRRLPFLFSPCFGKVPLMTTS